MIYLDAEYCRPAEADLGLVSVAASEDGVMRSWWIADPIQRADCEQFFLDRRGQTIVAYAVELAEGRVMEALFSGAEYFGTIKATDWSWIDCFVNWRWLGNQDDAFCYGRIIGGNKFLPRIMNSVPPPKGTRAGKKACKAERDEAAEIAREWAESQGAESAAAANRSLLDALVFFGCIGEEELREEARVKQDVRDFIIKGKFLVSRKDEILRYNEQDVARLPALWEAQAAAMDEVLRQPHITLDPKVAQPLGSDIGFHLLESVAWRGGAERLAMDMGMWAAQCAVYAMRGLPLHAGRWGRALAAAPVLIDETKERFNAEHWPRFRVEDGGIAARTARYPTPDTDDEEEIGAAWAKRVGSVPFPYTMRKFVGDASAFARWAQEQEKARGIEWKRTDTGAYASDREYLGSLAADSDLCPIKAYQRCTKEIDALVGLTRPEKGLPRTVGSDHVHRFATDPYATQTSRNGQGASRFIMSGPHWMRALVEPREGEALVELDFGSQEIFIAAALSGDANYMRGYESGDPYWTYAVLTGAIPADIGTPTEEQRGQEPWSQYSAIRQSYKSTFLGIGFGMGAKSLAMHLTRDTGRPWDADEAKGMIDAYCAAYPDYTEYRRCLKELYQRGGVSMLLADGWRMGPDCPVPNSFLNLPVQGHGAVILRRACTLMDRAGLHVVATMHDAVTICCAETKAEKMAEEAAMWMKQASREVLGVEGMRVGMPEIIRHGDLWMHSKKAKTAWAKIGRHIDP